MQHQLVRYEFGEMYTVVHQGPKIYKYNDLEELLQRMHDFFATHAAARKPTIFIDAAVTNPSASDPLGQRGGATSVLVVEPILAYASVPGQPTMFRPRVSLDLLVPKVREYVTGFNLSGTWDQFANRNGNL